MISLIQHPSRKKALLSALVISLIVHIGGLLIAKYVPIVEMAYNLSGIRFVDEEFDKSVLVTFQSKLSYPSGYAGFQPPTKVLSPEEAAKLEVRRRARLAAENRRLEKLNDQQVQREQEETKSTAAQNENKDSQLAQQASPAPTATPTPKSEYPGGFGKINTAPIKAQVQRLYDAKQEGKLVIPEGKLKVGVTGSIRADGTLADCRVIVSSGVADIDRAALAILDAVSASRALGPLHEVTSLSMILNVDENAELNVVGFTPNEQAASNIVNLANAAILYARIKKADDPSAMVMINNLKVSRNGQRVHAVIRVSRDKASTTMAQSFAKP